MATDIKERLARAEDRCAEAIFGYCRAVVRRYLKSRSKRQGAPSKAQVEKALDEWARSGDLREHLIEISAGPHQRLERELGRPSAEWTPKDRATLFDLQANFYEELTSTVKRRRGRPKKKRIRGIVATAMGVSLPGNPSPQSKKQFMETLARSIEIYRLGTMARETVNKLVREDGYSMEDARLVVGLPERGDPKAEHIPKVKMHFRNLHIADKKLGLLKRQRVGISVARAVREYVKDNGLDPSLIKPLEQRLSRRNRHKRP